MESGSTSRIPNLLHFFSFIALTVAVFILSEIIVLTMAHGVSVEASLKDERLQLFVNMLTYSIALSVAYFVMPLFWNRSFSDGLKWNFAEASPWLGLGGLTMGFAAQGVTVFIPHQKELPIEQIFHNPAIIWFLVVFAVLVGPLFEEIVFRGFLLPAIAIAVDWLRIPRGSSDVQSLENLDAWRQSADYSSVALVISSLITSALFAAIHGPQLGYTLPALALLMCVSLVLCFVRLRTGSVAASTIVHGCYNLSVFLTLFVSTSGFRHLDKI